MTDRKTRYDNPPISDHTRSGMTLTSDDLQAIGRLLMLQDDAYEEQFEILIEGQEEIKRKLVSHERRIKCLEDKVGKLIA